MDIISFIPGVGPTAPFSPGPTTPAPYNVNHTGATDGTNPQTATLNQAEIYNRLLLQIAALIDNSGIGIDNNNWAQLPQAVRAIAQQVVNGAIGTGVVTTAQYNNDFRGSLTPNGYFFLKGLLVQWGSQATPTNQFPVFFNTTFPIAFPNGVFQVYESMSSLANLDIHANVHETECRVVSKSVTSVQWLHDFVGDELWGYAGPQYPIVFWLAIGF